MSEPRCPRCHWRLKFRRTRLMRDGRVIALGAVWEAVCWNPHCPERDAGETVVPVLEADCGTSPA